MWKKNGRVGIFREKIFEIKNKCKFISNKKEVSSKSHKNLTTSYEVSPYKSNFHMKRT